MQREILGAAAGLQLSVGRAVWVFVFLFLPVHGFHSIKPLVQEGESLQDQDSQPSRAFCCSLQFGCRHHEVLSGSRLGQGPCAKLQSTVRVVAAEHAPVLLPQGCGAATSLGRDDWDV